MSRKPHLPLALASLLFGGVSMNAATIGYYQFEDSPGVIEDSSANNRDLTAGGTAGGQVASPFGSVSNPPDGSVQNTEAMSFSLNRYFTTADRSYSDLTIEAFVNLNSVDSAASSRVFASQFGTGTNRAFNFGVAGNGSTTFSADRTLFLQLYNSADTLINLDSTFRLTLGVNYYLAASIDAGALNGGVDGSVTFYLKDLTNGGSLQTATVTAAGLNAFKDSNALTTIGGSNGGTGSLWDGTIDEVRFSDTALGSNELLVSSIPEPSSFAAVAGGLALIGVACRRKRTGS